MVRSTRYSKILAGGTHLKDGLVINKNPGPGQYREGNSIMDVATSKAKTQSSSFASTLGKSWYSTQLSPNGSPRACAFAKPHSGEPFNEFGFLKSYNERFNKEQTIHRVIAQSKCCSPTGSSALGGNGLGKTAELLDFLRMNDRILRFKKRTVRNIEEALHAVGSYGVTKKNNNGV